MTSNKQSAHNKIDQRDLCRKWCLTPRNRPFWVVSCPTNFTAFFGRFWPSRRDPEKPIKGKKKATMRPGRSENAHHFLNFSLSETKVRHCRPSIRRPSVSKIHAPRNAKSALNPKIFLWVAWSGNSYRRGRPGEATHPYLDYGSGAY